MDFNYENELSLLKERDARNRSEEDVKVVIVEPVLKYALGYDPQSILREHQLQFKRPDFLCYRSDEKLDLIVEAKALEVNLDLRPSRSDPATRIPKIQLEEYLRKRPDSNHGVFGLLTNGEEWRVCRRIEHDVVWLKSAIAPTWEELQDALAPLLSRSMLPEESDKHSTIKGQKILCQISSCLDHRDLLKQLAQVEKVERQTDLLTSVRLAHFPGTSVDFFPESQLVTIGSRAQDGILSVADIYDALRGELPTSSFNQCKWHRPCV